MAAGRKVNEFKSQNDKGEVPQEKRPMLFSFKQTNDCFVARSHSGHVQENKHELTASQINSWSFFFTHDLDLQLYFYRKTIELYLVNICLRYLLTFSLLKVLLRVLMSFFLQPKLSDVFPFRAS